MIAGGAGGGWGQRKALVVTLVRQKSNHENQVKKVSRARPTRRVGRGADADAHGGGWVESGRLAVEAGLSTK